MRLIAACLASVSTFIGCATNPITPPNILFLDNQTSIPSEINPQKNLMPGIEILKVPEELLIIKTIKRPRIEVRQGPGLQFTLSDRILEQGRQIIVTDRSGIWRKIFDPVSETAGWVHHKTLQAYKSAKRHVTIKKKFLPKVFASKNSLSAKTYKTKKTIHLKIAKGTPFYSLQGNRDKILVIVGQTKSIVWLAKKDAL